MDISGTTVVAIAAIIAQLITTYLNNNNQEKLKISDLENQLRLKNLDLQTQLKLKNADLFYKEKSEAYQKYCATAQTLIPGWLDSLDDDKNQDKVEYLKVHQLAYLMSDDTTRSLLDKLNSYYAKPIYSEKEINNLFTDIVKAMNDDLSQYRNNL